MTDPRTTADETPSIAVELFEPALREGLTGFFQRALHRDVDCRFDAFRQMEEAWRAVFITADAAAPATTPATVGSDADNLDTIRDAAASAAELDTPLEAAGLSPRAVSVAHTFNATTVGALLEVRLHQIAKARGAGALIRKELNRRHKQWTATLGCPTSTQATSPTRSAKPGIGPENDAGPAPEATAQLTVEEMVARLTPSPGHRSSKKSDVVWLTLGLPRPGDDDNRSAAQPWPTQGTIAQRLGITQASVSRHHKAAIKEWAAERWLTDVRNELVELVAAAGRVMTADELAAALRVRHGVATDEPPKRTMVKASAVVRAAVEAETWPDGHDDPAGTEPRLAVRRRGQRVLIALESLPGTDDPSAPELADYAFALGRKAEELARRDPLPGRAVVLRDLRAVTAPEGLAPLADTRLVALAAAVSHQVAASPRLELYPRELDLTRALRISQAAAAVHPESGIAMDELLARVQTRFPDLAIDARFTETGQISPGFASYLRAVWTGVTQRLLNLAVGPTTVLFVHNAGLLARYYDQGGHELLTRLQAAARRPRELPHGFWLLCPAESPLDTPNLDGRTVEVLDTTERVVLSKGFLAVLRGEAGTAA